MSTEQTHPEPRTLLDAVRYFEDPDRCLAFAMRFRWPNGKPVCPRCGGLEHSFLTTRRIWKCKGCRRQFSLKVGTIFEDSPIGCDKWLPAMWMVANSKNGVSSHELARALGVTQKTAWFMCHRLRLAMKTKTFEKLDGEVEVDETFIGGLARNMHKDVRSRKITGTGHANKTIVAGGLERGTDVEPSRVHVAVIPDRSRASLRGHIEHTVEAGTSLYTDEWQGYTGLEGDYAHKTVDHAIEYVSGRVHTNGIENFWSLLKRGLKGTYVCAQPYHLHRYLDERVFTFNERQRDDLGRMTATLSEVGGRRVTYKELTGHA